MTSDLPNNLNILSAGNCYFELFPEQNFRIFRGENFIFSWRCICCKNRIRLAYHSGLRRAGKEGGSTQPLWMEDEQRHFVCNWMASAWLNVTHDECHRFFCPFQIAVRQGEGLGSYAQPWWNSCLIPDLFCPLQPASKFIILPLFHTVVHLFFFLITQISLDNVVGFFLRITDNEEILRKITVHSTLQGGSILHSRNT